MSYKVYNGYILKNKNLNEAFELLNSVQKEAISIAKDKMKEATHNLIKAQKTGDKDEGFFAITKLFLDLKQKVIAQNESIPFIDYNCELVLIPYKEDTLILKYTEQRDLYNPLFESIGIEPFYYWNNTDLPDNISESHWRKRKNIWESTGIFNVGNTPSQQGVTYNLVTWNNYDNLFDYR